MAQWRVLRHQHCVLTQGRCLFLQQKSSVLPQQQTSVLLTSRHLSCRNSRHLSCLNSRHLSCLSSRLLGRPSADFWAVIIPHLSGAIIPHLWDDGGGCGMNHPTLGHHPTLSKGMTHLSQALPAPRPQLSKDTVVRSSLRKRTTQTSSAEGLSGMCQCQVDTATLRF